MLTIGTSIRPLLPELVPAAQAASRETGIYASVLLALAQNARKRTDSWRDYYCANHSVINIRPEDGYNGPTYRANIAGYVGGFYVQRLKMYKGYDTWADGIMAAARYLIEKRPAVLLAKSPEDACRAIDGIPTGNHTVWADLMILAIRKMDLKQYDLPLDATK